jgi:hypothetical protein
MMVKDLIIEMELLLRLVQIYLNKKTGLKGKL